MNGPNAPSGPYEGAFASRVLAYNLEVVGSYASALAGAGSWQAGPGGVLQGRFGYGNPSTGLVLNSQTTAADALGVVVPLQSVNAANGGVIGGPAAFGGPQASWTWQYYDCTYKAWRLRQGIVCTLMMGGAFWLRFAGGANYGDTVYASLTDGSACSGPLAGYVATPWKVCSNARPGCLAIVSSTAKFT
jgi:hypothetical protein